MAAPEWAFWVKWYEDALSDDLYREANRDLLTRIALIDDADWKEGPKHIAALIEDIQRDLAGARDRTSLAGASIYDYRRESRDHLREWMILVGYDEDLKYLDDPNRLRAFNRDAAALRDALQDFVDFAREGLGSNSAPLTLAAAEKVLEELEQAGDGDALHAAALIRRAAMLNGFALEEDPKALFGPTLAQTLSGVIDDLLALCRTHLAAGLARLAPLGALELGDADPTVILADLRRALAPFLEGEGPEGVTPLSPEARAAFRDWLVELSELADAAEAATGDRRETLRKRFAERWGAFTVSIGRYLEMASEGSVKWLDRLIAGFKRFKSLSDMIDFVQELLKSQPPT